MNAVEHKSPAITQPICTFYSLHNTAQYTSQHRPLIETEPPRTQLLLSQLATTRNMMCVCMFESAKDRKGEKSESFVSLLEVELF